MIIDDYRDYKEKIKQSPYYQVQKYIEDTLPEYSSSHTDSVSNSQYESKKWLCDILSTGKFGKKDPLKIEIVGSWFGWPFIEMLEEAVIKIDQLDLYDLDEHCHNITRKYFGYFKPEYKLNIHYDYFERNDHRIRHMIICTSCEHMDDIVEMKEYYKETPKPVLVLQSNNYYEIEDHINCVDNAEELAFKNEIVNIQVASEKDFGYYKRFLVIGTW